MSCKRIVSVRADPNKSCLEKTKTVLDTMVSRLVVIIVMYECILSYITNVLCIVSYITNVSFRT